IYLGRGPAPAPETSGSTFAEEYANSDEDAVLEVEEMMLDVAAQLKDKAWGGVLYHVASDYSGTPFFRSGEGAATVVGGVTVRSAGAEPRSVDRAGFRR